MRVASVTQSVALSGIRYKVEFYRQDQLVDQTDFKSIQIIGLLGINDYKPFDIYETSNQQWDRVNFIVSQPGITVGGGTLRIYEVSRTVGVPQLGPNQHLDVYLNNSATISAKANAQTFIWYLGVRVYNADTQSYYYTIDDMKEPYAITIGSPSGDGDDRLVSSFTTPSLTQDTTLFLRTVRNACLADTSAPLQINLTVMEVPLPISIESFNAKAENGNGFITWTTAMEQDVVGFEIEKSIDGNSWSTIGKVASAANGYSSTPLHYSFTDGNLTAGKNYYRLKVLENTNKVTYSAVQLIDNNDANEFNVYPNPATDVVTVSSNTVGTVRIYSATGHLVKTIAKLTPFIKVSLSELPAGTYMLQLVDNKMQVSTQKLIVK